MPPKTKDNITEERKARYYADAILDDAEYDDSDQDNDYEPTYRDGSLKNECWNDSLWRDD